MTNFQLEGDPLCVVANLTTQQFTVDGNVLVHFRGNGAMVVVLEDCE